MGTEEPKRAKPCRTRSLNIIMSTLNYAWNVRGTLNGDFMSASGTTASVDGIADVHGTAGEGAPFNHSTWIWGGLGHYGLAWFQGGHKENPTEKYPFHMTRHWYGEDGSHIWSSHTVTGAEGAWAGDIACVAEHFVPGGPILGGYIRGQWPSHWVATKRSDREVDVHGIVTLKVEGGGTYTAHVHEYIKFWEPCVTINRHFWKVHYLEAEYYPTHWYHKEKAICDPNWNWGATGTEKMTFAWHLFGTIGNKCIDADGYGYGAGYRQHHWGKGGKGWGEHGLPNLNWALAWEGHAGLHFFTLFPKDSLSTATGGDRMAPTGPPPTTLDSTVPTSTRRSSSSVMASRETASCGGTATKTRAPGSSRAGPNTPSPSPRVTNTSGTEPPSNSNSTTALTTPATGKWTFTSENPLTRCPLLTSSNSSPRPGIPSPTTGTSTRERKSNSPLTTRLSKELIMAVSA